MPFHSARKVSAGDGSRTLSTTSYQTARYQMAIRPITPMIGKIGIEAEAGHAIILMLRSIAALALRCVSKHGHTPSGGRHRKSAIADLRTLDADLG